MLRDCKIFSCYQLADKLNFEVKAAIAHFPEMDTHQLAAQMKRAAASVVQHLELGLKHSGSRDSLQTIYVARTAAFEIKNLVTFAGKLKYLENDEFKNLLDLSTKTLNDIYNLISRIQKSSESNSAYKD